MAGGDGSRRGEGGGGWHHCRSQWWWLRQWRMVDVGGVGIISCDHGDCVTTANVSANIRIHQNK